MFDWVYFCEWFLSESWLWWVFRFGVCEGYGFFFDLEDFDWV